MFRRFLQFFILLIFLALGGIVWCAWYLSTPLLNPLSSGIQSFPQASSVSMTPIVVTSADGTEIEGYLAEPSLNGAFTEKQNQLRDIVKERGKLHHLDNKSELVLICVSWDQGVAQAMPLVESLTGIGYSCVIWNPRGKDNNRKYCTYGLVESADVTALLDQISERKGSLPPIAGIGQGFGAAVLMKAATEDPRIRCLVCMDCFPSLKTVAAREMEQDWGKPLCYPAFWLMDSGIEYRADFSTFDISPVDCAGKLDFPTMLVCTDQYFFSNRIDNLGLFDALKDEKKQLYEPNGDHDPAGDKERDFVHVTEGKKGERFEKIYKIQLYSGEDELHAAIAEWIQDNTRMPMPRVLLHESVSSMPTGSAPL